MSCSFFFPYFMTQLLPPIPFSSPSKPPYASGEVLRLSDFRPNQLEPPFCDDGLNQTYPLPPLFFLCSLPSVHPANGRGWASDLSSSSSRWIQTTVGASGFGLAFDRPLVFPKARKFSRPETDHGLASFTGLLVNVLPLSLPSLPPYG